MGPSREVIGRAVKRVGLSSFGEIVGRAVNLILPFVLLSLHEAGTSSDLFFLLLAIALFSQGTLTNTLVNALVPDLVDRPDRLNATTLAWVSSAVGVTCAVVSMLVVIEHVTVGEAFVYALSVAVMASVSLFAAPAVAILNLEDRYGLPGITWGLRIIPVIFYYLSAPSEPMLHWLLLGISVMDLARSIVLVSVSPCAFCLNSAEQTISFPLSARHLLLASMITGFTPVVMRGIASIAGEGAISIFEAADRLYATLASLATIGMGNVVMVYLSRLPESEEGEQSWRLILRVSFAWGMLWMLLGGMFWFTLPWLFSSFDFQSDPVRELISAVFIALIAGLPGFVMTNVLGRRLVTTRKSSTLILMSVTGLLWCSCVGWLLLQHIGIAGLGWALSSSQYVVAMMMYRELERN